MTALGRVTGRFDIVDRAYVPIHFGELCLSELGVLGWRFQSQQQVGGPVMSCAVGPLKATIFD